MAISDIAKKVGSIFVNIEEEEVVQTQQKVELRQSAPTIAPALSVQLQPSCFDMKIAKNLEDAIRATPSNGFGYIQFKDAMNDMKSSISDESSRFKAAYATAKAMKISAESIISSAQQSLKTLISEKKVFSAEVENARQSEIVTKTSQITDIENKIKENQNTVARLNKETIDLQDQKVKLSGSLAESQSRIDAMSNNFEITYATVESQIKEDIEKIKTYIGVAK